VILEPCATTMRPSWINSPRARADGEFREAPHLSRGLQASYRRKLSVPTWDITFFAALSLQSTTTALKEAHTACVGRTSTKPPSRGPHCPLGCNASRDARAAQGPSKRSLNYKALARDLIRVMCARADHRGQGASFRGWATGSWEGKLSRALTPFW
jgi:hypothetical protein